MYRVTLNCTGVPSSAGQDAAVDITNEFRNHRDWHKNAQCTWDGTNLKLVAENDFDKTGLALHDEFSDCISAYISELFDGKIEIKSVELV